MPPGQSNWLKRPTVRIPVDPREPQADVISAAAAVIRRGGLVAFPTETVYGLGANALDADAVASIFEAKGRPASNPVIVHVASVEEARALASDWPEAAETLARHFWPGPLTLVVPRVSAVPDAVTGGGPTVGLRMPANPIALALLLRAGVPIAAPSANRSLQLSPTTASHVMQSLNERVDVVLDGGPCAAGIESTVVDTTAWPVRILRPGPVTADEIAAVLGDAVAVDGLTEGIARAPGQLARHYAPVTPLVISAQPSVSPGRRVAWVSLAGAAALPGAALHVEMPGDARAYGAKLYACLHLLDQMALDTILVEMPPDEPEWQAVRDRLRRASADAPS